MGPAAAAELGEVLADADPPLDQGLKEPDISENGIGEGAMVELVDGLRNAQLTKLTLSCTGRPLE